MAIKTWEAAQKQPIRETSPNGTKLKPYFVLLRVIPWIIYGFYYD